VHGLAAVGVISHTLQNLGIQNVHNAGLMLYFVTLLIWKLVEKLASHIGRGTEIMSKYQMSSREQARVYDEIKKAIELQKGSDE
jgi:hypothetical protein